jgi:hypothetical protein
VCSSTVSGGKLGWTPGQGRPALPRVGQLVAGHHKIRTSWAVKAGISHDPICREHAKFAGSERTASSQMEVSFRTATVT